LLIKLNITSSTSVIIMNFISKLLTHGYHKVPLFWVYFDLPKYRKLGAKGSCMLHIHPELKDNYIIDTLNNLVDYIRDNYDMERLTKL
jgi:hypothetical protein